VSGGSVAYSSGRVSSPATSAVIGAGLAAALVLVVLAVACSGKRPSDGAREGAQGARARPDTGGAPAAAETAAPAQAENPATGDADAAHPASGAAMEAAAQALVDAAGSSRPKLALGFDDKAREDWSYVPRSRAGLALGDMTEAQRDATHALIDTGVSPAGHQKVRGILLIEPILGQIEGNASFRDPGKYHVAVFGRPGSQAPWGWRFEGHHLSLNFTEAGGHIASTPAFFGANPARVGSGKNRGLRVLAAEEDLGSALFASLTDEQRGRAVLSRSAPSDIVTEASRRVSLAHFEGLPASAMTAEQRAALRRLIEVYVENLQPDLAREHLQRMEAAPAWAASTSPGRAARRPARRTTTACTGRPTSSSSTTAAATTSTPCCATSSTTSATACWPTTCASSTATGTATATDGDHSPRRIRARSAMKSSARSKWASSTASSASRSAR